MVNSNLYDQTQKIFVQDDLWSEHVPVKSSSHSFEWRDVPEFPGYKVSEDGRVLGVRGKELKPSVSGGRWGEYDWVSLHRDGRRYKRSVHSIVASAFLGDRPDGYDINHKDGDKRNNNYMNLEYVTPGDNQRHAIRNGLKGDITEDIVRRVKNLYYCRAISSRRIAKFVGISQRRVKYILKSKTWRDI